MKNNFKVLGFTDTFNTCDRCGKQQLKGVYIIETELGEQIHLGTSCIKKAYQMTQKELTQKLSYDEFDRQKAAREEFYSSELGIFYKNYKGSAEKTADMKKGGLGLVSEKLKPAEELIEKLAEKYHIGTYRIR